MEMGLTVAQAYCTLSSSGTISKPSHWILTVLLTNTSKTIYRLSIVSPAKGYYRFTPKIKHLLNGELLNN